MSEVPAVGVERLDQIRQQDRRLLAAIAENVEQRNCQMGETTNVSTTHHTLEVGPWEELPGGVKVGNWGDCVDAVPGVMLLLRDEDEVRQLIDALNRALPAVVA